jgi:hypothetical protein
MKSAGTTQKSGSEAQLWAQHSFPVHLEVMPSKF